MDCLSQDRCRHDAQCFLSIVTSVVLNVYHGMMQHSIAVNVLFPNSSSILKFLFYTSVRFEIQSWGGGGEYWDWSNGMRHCTGSSFLSNSGNCLSGLMALYPRRLQPLYIYEIVLLELCFVTQSATYKLTATLLGDI